MHERGLALVIKVQDLSWYPLSGEHSRIFLLAGALVLVARTPLASTVVECTAAVSVVQRCPALDTVKITVARGYGPCEQRVRGLSQLSVGLLTYTAISEADSGFTWVERSLGYSSPL